MASFYERFIGAPLIDALCGTSIVTHYRELVVPLARGVVLELGIGSCLNLPFYEAGLVERVIGVDPSARMRELGAARIAAAPFPVECVGLSGEDIALAPASVDTVVVTFSLCTIPDPVRALKSARKILKPGGKLLFLEHGRAPDAAVATWQDRLNGAWNVLACGCNLNRNTPGLVEDGGFNIDSLDQGYARGLPKPAGYLYWGVAG